MTEALLDRETRDSRVTRGETSVCFKPVAHFGAKRATIASHGLSRARAISSRGMDAGKGGGGREKRGTAGREMENKKGGGWLLGGGKRGGKGGG